MESMSKNQDVHYSLESCGHMLCCFFFSFCDVDCYLFPPYSFHCAHVFHSIFHLCSWNWRFWVEFFCNDFHPDSCKFDDFLFGHTKYQKCIFKMIRTEMLQFVVNQIFAEYFFNLLYVHVFLFISLI